MAFFLSVILITTLELIYDSAIISPYSIK